MFLHEVYFVPSYCCIIFTFVNMPQLIYPFYCKWIYGAFLVGVIMNNITVDIFVLLLVYMCMHFC